MTTQSPVYLDYNATTPVEGAILETMLPWFRQRFGNASSTHLVGRRAAGAVLEARESVAAAMGVPANGIVFTSGATEADNLALRGVSGRVVVAATEHKAVLETAQHLDCSIVSVNSAGQLDLDEFEHEVRGASLVSVMLANNETGIVQDFDSIVEIARRNGCLIHTDATQAFGKLPINIGDLDVDLISVSSHKIYGPQGVGALYVRQGVKLSPLMTGGGHERGLRSGTLNVPAIVGFGTAARILAPVQDGAKSRKLLDLLLELLGDAGPFEVFSNHHTGLPNTLSIRFSEADAEAVIANTPEVAVSTGSACSSAVPEPSHVLTAMGIPVSCAFETLRISIGRPTTPEEIAFAASALTRAVRSVRHHSVRSVTPDGDRP